MAVTITDRRTRLTEADAITGWTASSGVAVFTSAPNPAEATGSLGQQVSNSTETAYFGFTAADLTSTIVYCWLLPGGVIDTTTNGGVQIYIGDGTDNIGFHVGGSDGAGFRHDEGPVVWQCFALDTASLPASTTAFTGSVGTLTLTSINRIGNAFKTLAKSVGGVENCFMDSIFYGNLGLSIQGGATGDRGNFLEIAVEDRSTASGTAYGICRELGTDLFGLQGPLRFRGGTGVSWFEDTGVTVVFEDRNFAADKYFLRVDGGISGGTTNFFLGNRTGAGTGANGCNLVCPSGVGASFTVTGGGLNGGIYASSLSGFTQGVSMPLFTGGETWEVYATSFIDCAMINVQDSDFRRNTILASAADGTLGNEAAVKLDQTTTVSGLSFTSAGTGHAIYIDTPGTYTFDGYSFTGYAVSNGSTGNEVLYNNSGGLVTINIAGGGDTPTVRNGTSATTAVNNTVSVKVTAIDSVGDPVIGARVLLEADSGGPLAIGTDILSDITDVNGELENATFNFTGDQPVTGRIRKSSTPPLYQTANIVGTITSAGFDVTTQLLSDE